MPIYSNAGSSAAAAAQRTAAEASRHVGSSADWEKLRSNPKSDADNPHLPSRHLEARQLAVGAPGVRRDGRFLFLETHDGRELRFQDQAPGNWTPSYFYYDVVPALDAYVLRAQYYEGNSWLLVSRETGARTELSGLPVVSPGKSRFVTGSYDMVADYNPNEVVVWAIGEVGTPEEAWKTEPEEWGPTFLHWLSPSKFRVRCESPHWYPDEPAPKPMSRTYELIDGKWKQVGEAEPWKD